LAEAATVHSDPGSHLTQGEPVIAAGSLPGAGEYGFASHPSRRRSFVEAATRAEIGVLQRILLELHEMGVPLTAQAAGLDSEETPASPAPGDHLAAAAPRAIRDVDGYDLRPNPLTAQTPAAFMAALRKFRTWAGDPPFRIMSSRSDPHLSAATLCTALSRDVLPTLAVVQGVITSCGGDEDDQRRFTTAWRWLRLKQEGTNPHEPQEPGDHAA
jgi:hypothetical protein